MDPRSEVKPCESCAQKNAALHEAVAAFEKNAAIDWQELEDAAAIPCDHRRSTSPEVESEELKLAKKLMGHACNGCFRFFNFGEAHDFDSCDHPDMLMAWRKFAALNAASGKEGM